jgi:hypothetical protein
MGTHRGGVVLAAGTRAWAAVDYGAVRARVIEMRRAGSRCMPAGSGVPGRVWRRSLGAAVLSWGCGTLLALSRSSRAARLVGCRPLGPAPWHCSVAGKNLDTPQEKGDHGQGPDRARQVGGVASLGG